MALSITISGDQSIVHGQQTVLTASVLDTDTGMAPTGTISYAWSVPSGQGSFISATDAASVTYLADIAGNAATTVNVTCEVTVAGTGAPSVSAPSLTAMDTLGITDQRVNMLITTEIDGDDLYDREDFANTIAAGSDTSLIGFDGIFQGTLNVYRIRWLSSNRIFRFNRHADDTTNMSTFWTAGHDTHSVYLILNDGSVIEIIGDWYVSSGGGFVSWRVPTSETAILALLNGISTGQMLLVGVGTADSISDTGSQSASGSVAVSVASNQPPVVTITAPSRLDRVETENISASITDPEGEMTSLVWSVTGGATIGDTTDPTTTITAPSTPGTIVLTATATDSNGQVGSSSQSIIVNSPPTVSINVTDMLEVNEDAALTAVVGDPDNDTVTVTWFASAGAIADTSALTTTFTAPSTPQTITITCLAIDSEGATTTATAQVSVIANQPPTITISVPSALSPGDSGPISANVSDPTNDNVTVLWSATGSATITDTTALTTTITAPSTAGSVTVTCVATDEHGATDTAAATLTVRQSNRPPTVQLNVPATAAPGQTVNIVATVTDLDGDNTEGEWRAPKGTIANPENESTTITLPSETGVVPLTYEAMDDMGATAKETTYITVGDPKANIYTPAYQIEIQGVDVTDRWIKRDGMTVGKSLDYPELLNFRSSGVQFNLDNADGAFDYSNPNNFFVSNSLPAHGRGAQVLVSLGRSQSELAPAFAGEISAVVTSLRNTKARIKARDLSVVLRQKTIENFGVEITRRITNFEGANADYDPLNPVFYFPVWGLPISRGSVHLTVHKSDGTTVAISIVDTIATEGVLSNENAEIDYNRGLIRFEIPPDDGADTIIDATWKQDYRYRRPDALIREILENVGIHTQLGLSSADAAFAIEQALVRHPTDRFFSSHGHPHIEREGITRWLMRDATNKKMFIAQDARLVEYDERNDEYTLLSTMPTDTTILENPPGGYGSALEDEDITVPGLGLNSGGNLTAVSLGGVAFTEDRIYMLNRQNASPNLRIVAMNYDGQVQTSEQITVLNTASNSGYEYLGGLAVYNGFAYVLATTVSGGRISRMGVLVFNLETGLQDDDRSFAPSLAGVADRLDGTNYSGQGLAITSTRIYILLYIGNILVLDHNGNRMTGEEGRLIGGHGIAVNDDYIFILTRQFVKVFRHDLTAVTSLDIQYSDTLLPARGGPLGLHITANRLYILHSTTMISVFSLAQAIDYQNLVPIQFDTHDFDSFYVLATNTSRGDITRDEIFNKNIISKYVRSTGTWSTILDADKGQPQLPQPYDFVDYIEHYADNRKNFRVIRRNNKTLIFYRRVDVDNLEASIAYINETDDIITNVRTEAYTNANTAGIPYSMDFGLDERSDGIYVYSFVVRYTSSSATLKVFRERVEPSGSETEIFSETFTISNDEYPISVSDVILADGRSKWYFTLSYFNDDDETVSKAELCTIAKDGSGSRTALKTYDNPLLSARSPVEMDGRYFYLEGGWVRRPKSSDDAEIPDDEHYYSDEGGRLIEIEGNNDITDHGIIWRSASKLDSPDPESSVYDGWGLHNSIVSNMIADERDNLHFVCGYGNPYRISNNLPIISPLGPAPASSNFVWVQWGQDLATKIPSFPTTDRRGWDLIQQLTQLMGWEIGFGPSMSKVDALQAADASISDWSANASFFFRPRTILPAKLRTAISASGSIATIVLNDSGLPAEVSEFPVPPAGAQYPVIIDKEMFTYTGVTPDANGRTLTGVSRAQHGSTAAAHSVDAGVYFVDYFASGERGTTLVSIQSRAPNFVNLRNDINIGYGATTHNTKNQRSIDDNGEFTFNLGTSQRLLSKQDKPWAEIIGDTYLKELSNLKEVLQFTLVFSPRVQSSQLVVIYQLDRVRIDFKLFRLVQMQHATHPRWQTGATALEIIPEGVPPRWLTVPRQLLRFNQNLNLDLNSYLAGTLPIQVQASGLPSGFSINNGVISGGSNTQGEHTISLTAANNDGEATTSFEMLIGQPQWPSIPVQSITESDYLTFDFSSYTPEGLVPITYELGGSAPSWVSRSGDFILGQPPNETGDQTYIIPIVATNAVGSDTVYVIVNVEDTD